MGAEGGLVDADGHVAELALASDLLHDGERVLEHVLLLEQYCWALDRPAQRLALLFHDSE